MNAPVATSPTQGARIGVMQVVVRGKVEASRRNGTTRYTRIVTPAPDEYSRPQTVEVRSKNQLGERDEIITVTAKLGGYARKPFKSTNAETGEITMVTPIDMTLDAVE